MRRLSRTGIAIALLLTTAAVAEAQGPKSCSIVNQNLYVRDVLSDIYLWYRYLPNVDPARFESPDAYLSAVRYRPLDSTFSYITSRAAEEAFFSSSQYIGLGFSQSLVGDAIRVLQVFPESPAAEAGLTRGAWIREINGRPVSDLVASGEIAVAFGPVAAGVEVDIAFQLDSRPLTRARLVKRVVTIPTVSLSRVYGVAGRRVGYLLFRDFVQPSNAALDEAFNALRAAGVQDLILDLRYNGGGLVSVARHLASLIGGVRTEGQVFAEFSHNERNASRNSILRFEHAEHGLEVNRLIVITTRASASASELVINTLRPFMPVVIVGERTYGKPVGQYPIPFCDKVLAPVSFTLRNIRGEGDYFGGFAPDCPAPDDAEHQLGDVDEASLREALMFAVSGACSPATSVPRFHDDRRLRLDGWPSLVNAD